MIMKILPLTVHTQHQFGLVGGSDTLSLVAPNRLYKKSCFLKILTSRGI